MIKNKINRRSLLTKLAAFSGATLFMRNSSAAMTETPSATEGPFYPKKSMRMADVDNDLVKIEGKVAEAGGEILMLKGQVTDVNGKPRSGLRVEIWQCDVNGKYLHTGDSRQVVYDQAFQGFGHDITNGQGEYSFRTIKPTKYPGRTPHIHVKVCTEKNDLLTSQFYIDNEPDNVKDSIFRRLSSEEATAVSFEIIEKDGVSEATVNIVV